MFILGFAKDQYLAFRKYFLIISIKTDKYGNILLDELKAIDFFFRFKKFYVKDQ